MKTRKNLVRVAILMVPVLLVNVCFAQRPANIPTPRKGADLRAQLRAELRAMMTRTPKAGQKQELGKRQEQYSQEEIAQVRSALLDLAHTIKELTQWASGKSATDKLDEATMQIAELSDEQLGRIRNGLNPSVMREELVAVRTTVSEYKMTLERQREFQTSSSRNKSGAAGVLSNDPPFPKAQGVCHTIIFGIPPLPSPTPEGSPIPTPTEKFELGPEEQRISVEVILAFDVLYFIAELVRDLAQDACNQVAAATNLRLACVIVDIIYVFAHALHFGVHFCEDELTGAVIDANYKRLFHIHEDLEADKTAIINNAIDNKNLIIDNSNTNKNLIIDNSNTNKTEIINNSDTNRTLIINNDNANATLLRDLLLRAQIEADLSTPDSAVPVALFVTPSAECAGAAPVNHCGQLDFVRQIVVQTISRLAGSSAAQANAFLAKGDQYKAAGNYKAAYQEYRKAYKSAAN